MPCANDFVSFEGTLHASYHTTYNGSSGRIQYDSMTHWSDAKGVGLNSGTTYVIIGKTSYRDTWGTGPSSYDYEDIHHLVGTGAGSDLFYHVNNHVTFAPDGTPKVSIAKSWYTCK